MGYARGSYEHRILAHLERNERASLGELFPVVRIDTSRVKDIVRDLLRKGELEEYKPGHYQLGPAAPDLEKDAGEGVEERILAALATRNRATRNVLASAVEQAPASLSPVLKAMSDRGLIELDGSAWVLTKKGRANAPGVETAEPPPKPPPKARARPRALQPWQVAPVADGSRPVPAGAEVSGHLPGAPPPPPVPPATPRTQEASATSRPQAAAALTGPPRPVEPRPASPAAPASLAAAPSKRPRPPPAWDDGFAFEPIVRSPMARVDEAGLDLADLPEVADGWVELRWDAARALLAVVPVAARSRHAVRLEGRRLASPHPGALLGKGTFPVGWGEQVGGFVVGTREN